MLSTVGSDVFDGNGLAVSEARGVSVDVSDGVIKAVSVALGTKGVSVIGANDEFVGRLVSVRAGGIGVDVRVQANDVRMHKIEMICVRLIREIRSPFGILYLNCGDVKQGVKKDPRSITRIDKLLLCCEPGSVLPFAVVALLVFFFCRQRLNEHERGRFSLRALKAIENVDQFLC